MTGRPPETRIAPDRGLLLLAMALTVVIFGVSLRVPLEIAVGSLYLIVVLLGLRAASDRFSVIAAVVVTTLMVVSAFLAPSEAHRTAGFVNRALSIVVVWITAGLVWQYKRAQHAAAAQADRTQRYLDVAGVILMALDQSGTVQMINRQGATVLGCREDEIVGADWFDRFVPERQRAMLRQLHGDITHTAAGIEYFENPVLRADGTERLIAWHNTVLQDEDGQILGTLSSGTDVTEEREAARRLRLSTKDLEDLKYALDQSAIVAITDVRGAIKYVNDKFCEISKYSRAELLGEDHRILNSRYHPKEFFRGLWQTIANGGIWRGEIRNRAKDGAFYWVDTTIVPFLDERGRPYQYMAIRSDITERKRAEALLREQTTLARLGEMAAVVAHEVKNPLAGIRGVLQVIGARMPADSRDRAIVSDVQERLDVLNDLLQDLLLFARPKEPKTAPVAVMPLVEDTRAPVQARPGHVRDRGVGERRQPGRPGRRGPAAARAAQPAHQRGPGDAGRRPHRDHGGRGRRVLPDRVPRHRARHPAPRRASASSSRSSPPSTAAPASASRPPAASSSATAARSPSRRPEAGGTIARIVLPLG